MNLYRFLADLIVAVHAGYIAFVILGMVTILVGGWRRWGWVRNFWFRLVHFLTIAIVAAEALLGIVCPLTTWENRLREAAGESTLEGSFVGRLMHDLVFVSAPKWILTTSYCVFALVVLLTFFLVPPRRPRRREKKRTNSTSSDD
ncbi:MAG: DUF2784 domain-containing protein [Pirellulales bacterium]|nr:DUF2784 domain-containing protein [Pirellulales bacterium]